MTRWSERQRGMLGAMGLRLWDPALPLSGEDEVLCDAAAAQAIEIVAPPIAAVPPPVAGSTATAPIVAEPASASRSSSSPVPESAGMGAARHVQVPPGALSERATRIAAMDWPELRAAVAGCTACSLCESRTRTVFGVGNERAHWMIVGEAPGENEDRQGEPFVGKAGQLLDNMLQALQLTRQEGSPGQQVFIANTLKCRPPRNRNPGPEELAQCEPHLQRQIALVQPRVILAMGKFAVKALLGSDEPIGRLRGRVHEYLGMPVVVTYHPAYLLRQLSDKAKAWDDLCLAASVHARRSQDGPQAARSS